MSVSARLATLLLLAVHLAVATAPCWAVRPVDRDRHADALAGSSVEHCPGHDGEAPAPSTWFDSFCPCGCQTGAPPGPDGARTLPALLLAETALANPPADTLLVAPTPQRARFAPAPPDHVPLAIA